jgi:hypothetical protein
MTQKQTYINDKKESQIIIRLHLKTLFSIKLIDYITKNYASNLT